MSCCGQSSAGSLTIRKQDIDEGLRLDVEYWGGRRIEVEGPVTHQVYTFSGLSRRGLIDPRDAPGILRNSLFRLIGLSKERGVHGAAGSETR